MIGWGGNADITGAGVGNEAVLADASTHYNNLMALLTSETRSAKGELKTPPSIGLSGLPVLSQQVAKGGLADGKQALVELAQKLERC